MAFIKVSIVLVLVAVAYATPVSHDGTEQSLEETLAKYIQEQEVTVDLPIVGSTVTLGARNLENDELDVKVKFSPGNQARKSKLKKIFAPILILVILKAITLIPLALGILGLKTWNAIQLSFVTFVISVGLAVYELCKKIAADHAHPIVSHSAWAPARSLNEDAQQMAYSSYK